MSKEYRYIRLENIHKYEDWDLVEVIPAKFEHHYDMSVICREETPKNDELQAEIERLTHKCDDCAGCTDWKCDCSNIRREAIEEFAQEIKNKLYDFPTMSDEDGEYDYVCMESIIDFIDKYVNEKVGDNDAN